jgi:RNA polymerase sigma-70 factor (ECF subfamily)
MSDNDKTAPAPGPQCPDFAEILRETTPDSSLFEQIALCFSDRLEEYAKYVCRDESAGQDAMQDAMLAAMTNLESYRGDSPIEGWLRRIVVSACSRIRRGLKNDPAVNRPLDAVEAVRPLAQPGADQELQLLLKERLELLGDEIEKLDEPNRSLLRLHDVEEVPIADLVGRFGMTAEAIKSRLKRGRALVRERLLVKVQ